MALVHLIYCSAIQDFVTIPDLYRVLQQSIKNNGQRGITGIVMYHDGSVLQILEGEEESVSALYEKICNDRRHHRIQTIIKEQIDHRNFTQWSMGFINLSSRELSQLIADFGEIPPEDPVFDSLDEGKAKQFLAAFHQGRWHSKVEHGTVLHQHH